MNIAKLQAKLLQAARRQPADDRVPYAFEKRVMARLASLPRVDVWSLWSRALWKAAAPCVALTLVLTAWSLLNLSPAPVQEVRVDELETTVLAPLDGLGDVW